MDPEGAGHALTERIAELAAPDTAIRGLLERISNGLTHAMGPQAPPAGRPEAINILSAAIMGNDVRMPAYTESEGPVPAFEALALAGERAGERQFADPILAAAHGPLTCALGRALPMAAITLGRDELADMARAAHDANERMRRPKTLKEVLSMGRGGK